MYNEDYFIDNKIILKRTCSSSILNNIYKKDDTIFLDSGEDVNCNNKANYKYYLIEIPKEIGVNNFDNIFSQIKKDNIYIDLLSNKDINIVVNSNNTFVFCNDKHLGDKTINYLETFSLTLEEAKVIYNKFYFNASVKIISKEVLNEADIKKIKEEIGEIGRASCR